MKKTIVFLMILTAAAACKEKKQVDVKDPIIDSLTIDGNEVDEVTLEAGSTFQVVVEISDNFGLNQVQLNIHEATNGHLHSGLGNTGGQDRLNSGTWAVTNVVNVTGTSSTQTWQYQIPDSVAGNWHLEITVLDDVGYTAIPYDVLIHVNNENLPVIEATTMPAADAAGTINMTAGTNLSVSGLATDPDKLELMFLYVRNSLGVANDTLFIPITGDGNSMAFGPATFDDAVAGNYRLVIEAFDSLGYHRVWDARLNVSN